MKKIFSYFIFFFLFFNLEGNSDEIHPIKENFEEVFNVGTMLSHDDKFTLYFRTREKAVLARGEEFNYITDYPQDLYILYFFFSFLISKEIQRKSIQLRKILRKFLILAQCFLTMINLLYTSEPEIKQF